MGSGVCRCNNCLVYESRVPSMNPICKMGRKSQPNSSTPSQSTKVAPHAIETRLTPNVEEVYPSM
ncbi:hypothetical protein P3L10_034291 [Capsicum annuum]